MSTLELKQSLIHRITEIDDISLLKAIKTILDFKSKEEIYSLTEEQKNEILASKHDVEKGLFINNEELQKEVDSWLKRK